MGGQGAAMTHSLCIIFATTVQAGGYKPSQFCCMQHLCKTTVLNTKTEVYEIYVVKARNQ